MKKSIATIICGALFAFALTSSANAQNCGCNGYQSPAISYGYAPGYSMQSQRFSQPYYSQPVYNQPVFSRPLLNRFRAASPSVVYSQPMQPMSTVVNSGMNRPMGGMLAMDAAAMPTSGICMQPCYNNCIGNGNSQSFCRSLCCQTMTMSVMAAPDGTDGICMQPCYNNCIANGKTQTECRALCCTPTVTFEKIDFSAPVEGGIAPVEQ